MDYMASQYRRHDNRCMIEIWFWYMALCIAKPNDTLTEWEANFMPTQPGVRLLFVCISNANQQTTGLVPCLCFFRSLKFFNSFTTWRNMWLIWCKQKYISTIGFGYADFCVWLSSISLNVAVPGQRSNKWLHHPQLCRELA